MKKQLTVSRFALGNLRHRRKQYTALMIAVVLAMMFSSGIPFFLQSMMASTEELMAQRYGKAEVIVPGAQDYSLDTYKKYISGDIGHLHVMGHAYTDREDKGGPIAWIDERGSELYYQQVSEGRLPEAPGEIAIEMTAMHRMHLEAGLGDTITLQIHPQQGRETSTAVLERQYTLVGILQDRRAQLSYTSPSKDALVQDLPELFVSAADRGSIPCNENLVALYNENHAYSGEELWEKFQVQIGYENLLEAKNGSVHNVAYQLRGDFILPIFLAALLAFLSCFAIANAFSQNLQERRKQIGMLRAVGATKRQIVQMFGMEALLLALVCTPLSMALAYLGVKGFALAMGDSFVFLPNIGILLVGGLFGLLCVLLSVLLPLLQIIRLTPMQAIRDTELMRKMTHKRIRSEKQFNVPRLIARRKLQFSRFRQIFICFLLAATTLLSCFLFSGLRSQIIAQSISKDRTDYTVSPFSWSSTPNPFVNPAPNGEFVSSGSVQETLSLGQVQRVYEDAQSIVNLQFSGEKPEYFRLLTLDFAAGTDGGDPQKLSQMRGDELFAISEEELLGPVYGDYLAEAGLTGPVTPLWLEGSEPDELMNWLEPQVVEGRIDLEKLNSGAEIILTASAKIGYYCKVYADGSWSMGTLDMNSKDEWTKSNAKHILAEADQPYHAGDTLQLTMLQYDEHGNIQRRERTVRIGAIVSAGNGRLFTTMEGLRSFGFQVDANHLGIDLVGEITPEEDEQMMLELQAIHPGKRIMSNYQREIESRKDFMTNVVAILSLVSVLLTVCICLMNNGINAQLRAGRSTNGTLRAVGASMGEIRKAYILQLLPANILGAALGGIGFALVLQMMKGFVVNRPPMWLTLLVALGVFAIVLGCNLLNLHVQMRKLSRYSIVENIREL